MLGWRGFGECDHARGGLIEDNYFESSSLHRILPELRESELESPIWLCYVPERAVLHMTVSRLDLD
jgi:hypothetical protein